MNSNLQTKMEARPEFPKRAVITGGMPYGNKELHLGHVGGYFVHADTLARFLRDRIGRENVIFVSGTDCYGSPITESYRKAREADAFEGTLQAFVCKNHDLQSEVLRDFLVDLNLFGGSSIEPAAEIHAQMTDYFMTTLHQNNFLTKLSTKQFYDTEREVFLNGRQVVGRCPIAGCQSDTAYADECALGHQYQPHELIAPKSMLTGRTPEMRVVENWYFKLEDFHALLREWVDTLKTRPDSRPYAIRSIEEFLEPPVIYLKRDDLEAVAALILPTHQVRDDGQNKSSIALVFETLTGREAACAVLSGQGLRFRTGKTLVPFRLTGNIEWGVKAPVMEGLSDLTVWVWPESLWAPISFTQAYLASKGETNPEAWRHWWCGDDVRVYQFIGQDNLYFYGPAQAALFMGMQGKTPTAHPNADQLVMTDIIANNHLLFLDKKASSSGKIKAPTARELLQFYTPEQLRAHFLGLGLSLRSVGFQPKQFNPNAKQNEADPALKEGNLLTNVLNRVARSCFYTAQKYTDSQLPQLTASEEAVDLAAEAALDFERLMVKAEFHQVMNLMDGYIRNMNKYWSKYMKEADAADDMDRRLQVLADCFHMLRVATVLMHPIAPLGTEMLKDYLQMTPNFFDWAHIFEPLSFFVKDPATHKLSFLEPRVDFFKHHESQIDT